MIKLLTILATGVVLVGCNAPQSNNSNHLTCFDSWGHRQRTDDYWLGSKAYDTLEYRYLDWDSFWGDEVPPQIQWPIQ